MSGEEQAREARREWAERVLMSALAKAGWTAERQPEADLLVEGDGYRYVVELKTAPEGRADRIVPLWSQACLQAARRAAGERALAVVAAPRIPESAADRLLAFAAEYAPGVGVGVLDSRGLRRFRGEGLAGLDADPSPDESPRLQPARSGDLFSDLNQWLLKVLLAPELPDDLLSAPRERYRNASALARAARVSTMSAYRFAQAFTDAGHLETSGRTMRLVRRKRLFSRWRAAAARPGKEIPIRLLVGANAERAAARLAAGPGACLGLFAAADRLGHGFVNGLPPYVYVRDLAAAAGDTLVPAQPYEPPDLFIREPRAAESVFRGAVQRDGLDVSDILQVWLDVASHPSRGREQADLIRQSVLEPLVSAEGGR